MKPKLLLISVQQDLDVIGLKYIHYFLNKHGHESTMLFLPNFGDANNETYNNLNNFIRDLSPDFIGISLMSIEYYKAKSITENIKHNFSHIPVLWGGIHPTIAPEDCLETADYVCIGEGEKTLLDIANAIEKGTPINKVKNLCFKENGEIKKNELYEANQNLDEVSYYEHIPFRSYIQEVNNNIVLLDKITFKKNARYNGTTYSIMGSRGCPFACTFCCNSHLINLYDTRRIRRRSVESIITELEAEVKKNPEIEYINFQDDCFLACTNSFLEDFSKQYKEKVNRPFIVRSIPTYVSEDKIRILKEAGLSWVSLGLQSGSDKTNQDVFKRKSYKKDFLRASNLVKQYNIAAIYDVILDNPFEQEEDRIETIKTLMETPKPYYTQFFSLCFYQGTEMDEMKNNLPAIQYESPLEKDYLLYKSDVINTITRLSTFLDAKIVEDLLNTYNKQPSSLKFKTKLFAASALSVLIGEPLNSFRVVKLSQNGSLLNTLKVLPNYLKEGLMRYLNQFKQAKA